MVNGIQRVEVCENVTLFCGDCREIAPTLSGIDAVISDPPYGMKNKTDSTRFSGGSHLRGDGRADWGPIIGDDTPFDPEPWTLYERCVLFGSNHYAARLPVGTMLIWIKKADHLFGSFLSDCEVAWMKGGHGVYAFRKNWNPPARSIDTFGRCSMATGASASIHPTQKPIGLMAWCMDRAKVPAGAMVLDPFMGSGTTGIACLRTGRRFIGIELDPVHFATAERRIRAELAQTTFEFSATEKHG